MLVPGLNDFPWSWAPELMNVSNERQGSRAGREIT